MAEIFGTNEALVFAEDKDSDDELSVYIEAEGSWITENDATGIIEHLKKVFGI